jgi:two-component system sensor histidine kinase YesM
MIALNVRKGLFNFVNDIPLNSKFLMIYILCVLVPILTINLVFWNKISNDMKERETENYNISINRVETDFSSILTGCIDVSHSVASDKALSEIMERHFNSNFEYYEVYSDLLRDRISRYLPIYNNVCKIAMYTSNNTIISGGSYFYINQSIMNTPWYRDFLNSNNKVVLYTYRDKSDNNSDYIQYLSVLRKLDEFVTNGKKNGQILKIDINMNKLYDLFDREKDYLDLFLVDPKGRIVCSTGQRYEEDLSKDYTDFNSISRRQTNNNYFKCKLSTAEYLSGWNIIGIANSNHFLRASRQSNIFIACIIFVVTLMSSFLIWIIVRSYNYRLKKLLKYMKKVENQKFELIETTEGKDEIGELVLSFNDMTSKINTLINDVYKLQLKKKDLEIQRVQAELKFLQSQVDPHFLFNTLNAVMAVCVKNNYTGLTEVIKNLSRLFRRLISWKDDLVTIQEEISFTEMYLKIEKFRFLDKFDYEIEVDEKALHLKVPKMSIQTIVENACKHGIQNTADVGVVKIKVSQKQEFLYVDVEDNGSGIESNKLREIIETLSEDDIFCENVGIKNVYKRLHLYYGNEVEFNIRSEMNKGTIVHYGINMNGINALKEEMPKSINMGRE